MKIYPGNKKHFKKLVNFAKKIILICSENKIKPIIYGSFAHFYYTQDRGMNVNDIDIYIPEKSFGRLIEALNIRNIKYKYSREWHTLAIKQNKSRVEIDSLDFWYRELNKRSLPRKFNKINFFGVKVRIITLRNLEKLYLIAYKRTKDNKSKIAGKIKHLETFLGRKLNFL